MKRTVYYLLILVFLPQISLAQNQKTEITAPLLRWEPALKRYHFEGGVTLLQEGSILKAEELYYYPEDRMAKAIGNVLYQGRRLQIEASRATLNLKDTSGTLENGRIIFFEGNYRIKADFLERLSEKHYRAKRLQYTTCSGTVPIWCLKASKADLLIGERLSAKHVRLHILGLPVLYTPYLWAPVLTERTTGFLMPRLGYNSERGFEVSLPFYLVISENRDATFYFDWAEQSNGLGLEYRYVERHIGHGQWLAYRFKDKTNERTFYSLKGSHRKDTYRGTGGFVSVDYLSEKDYYRLYSYKVELIASRFTASTSELYHRQRYYKVYLRARYWQNLASQQEPAQHMPVVGVSLYPLQKGPFLAGLTAEAARFYQKQGIEAYRLTVLPYLYHSTETVIRLNQSLEPFVAYYNLNDTEKDENIAYGLTYRAGLSAPFYHRWPHITHTVSPEILYEYRTRRETPSYIFDDEETDTDLSIIKTGITQRVYLDGEHLGALRLHYWYDLRKDNPSELVLEGYKTGTINTRFDLHYDTETSLVNSYHYQAGLSLSRVGVSFGETYSREPAIRNYTGSATLTPLRWLVLTGGFWYDQRQDEFTKITYGGKIDGQCASLSITYSKTRTQYSIFLLLTFKGLGEVKYGEML